MISIRYGQLRAQLPLWVLLSSVWMLGTGRAAEKVLFEFGKDTSVEAWQVVNDDVMGGVSRSRFWVTNNLGVFSGQVSLENNGGFASVRTRPGQLNCEDQQGFLVRLRGDGRRYRFTVRTDDRFDGVLYQLSFPTQKGEWKGHWLPFPDFKPTYRGRVLSDVPPLDPARITSVGFLIADKQAGQFELEIDWIKALPKARQVKDR